MIKPILGWLLALAILSSSHSQAAVYEGTAGGFTYRATASSGELVVEASDPTRAAPYIGLSWFVPLAESFDFTVSIISGPSGYPEYFRDYSALGWVSTKLIPPPAGSIRLSDSITTTLVTAVDPLTGVLIAEDADVVQLPGVGQTTSVLFSGSLRFEPGNLLAPSEDPACAAFTCMQPLKDQLEYVYAGASIFYAPVPELPPVYMMLGSVLLLGPIALFRRRRAMTKRQG